MAIIEEVVEGEEELLSKIERIKKAGNEHFGNGEFEKAVEKYKEAIDLLATENSDTIREVLYSNLAAALIKQEKWQDAVDAATKSIDINNNNEKALERRAFAYSQISEKLETSVEDYKNLQTLCPKRTTELGRKIQEISKKIDERNEKLKDEVIEKLKGFGDFCLRPFGLSTNSFELKDNGQGGFSVQMKQGAGGNEESEKVEEK